MPDGQQRQAAASAGCHICPAALRLGVRPGFPDRGRRSERISRDAEKHRYVAASRDRPESQRQHRHAPAQEVEPGQLPVGSAVRNGCDQHQERAEAQCESHQRDLGGRVRRELGRESNQRRRGPDGPRDPVRLRSGSEGVTYVTAEPCQRQQRGEDGPVLADHVQPRLPVALFIASASFLMAFGCLDSDTRTRADGACCPGQKYDAGISRVL